ncbi:MAG: FKBP-type peptidyl-prolyl cis-trans isomerase [Culturomica sp.]|jgi:FKBP-type peptidyl-prolyl cis-trans isomerase SlyD|nr:FKBP-type peptidyl-prolyl cis-trans isomerase [Culturomica sp.]
MITKNKMVSVSYELRTGTEGDVSDVLEKADAAAPLEFICGQGQTLEYFEMNLLGKKAHERFDFKIPAAQAYGAVNPEMIVDLPAEIFKETPSEQMAVGHFLPMVDSIGRRLQGKIVEIGADEVRIDFNHPLAGKDLYFKGEVLAVRDATDEELEALKAHKCGGGCGSCGSGGDCGGGGGDCDCDCDCDCGGGDEGCGCGGCH